MSETAKQDPTKAPAEPAAAESAATQGEAQPEEAAEPEEAGEDAVGEPAKPDLDETKRKFREALERKHQAHNDSQARNGRDGGKISGTHGPAASRRNFRRKSGLFPRGMPRTQAWCLGAGGLIWARTWPAGFPVPLRGGSLLTARSSHRH